jgi:serine/threonine-protein kinase
MINDSGATLKMVPCGGCGRSVFITRDKAPLDTEPCPKCGHPVMIPMQLRQFELRAVIASGGMGTVYKSRDTTLEREVAVKLMKRQFVNDPAAVESFAREAKVCAGLNHTNIIHIYTFDEHEGEKYIAMELANCGSLEGRIEQDRTVDELHVLDVGIKMCSALNAAGRHGLLHLDIKPANILYNAEGEPKLVDFGLARKEGDIEQNDEGVLGTPEYIAPERVLREGESFLSDMYSLAATMYNALVGHVPFTGDDVSAIALAHTTAPLTPPRELVPEISQTTNDAIVRAMAKNPNERFRSYDEFSMELEAARSRLLMQRHGITPS